MILKELANGLNFFKTYKTPNQKVNKNFKIGCYFFTILNLLISVISSSIRILLPNE